MQVAVLRLYTGPVMFREWNRWLREDGNACGGDGFVGWATSVAVLYNAVIKLSQV